MARTALDTIDELLRGAFDEAIDTAVQDEEILSNLRDLGYTE